MIRIRYCFFAILVMLISFSCSKEYSLETNNGTAHGSLQSNLSGDCLPKTVAGAFLAGKALTDSNFIQIDINVSSIGYYKISTDTVNGFSFVATGVFATTGINTIKLIGKGSPLSSGTNLFVISYDSSFCLVEVSVLPASAGGPAAFTLQGSPASCLNAVVAGTYSKDVALNSSNKVNIEVNVTSIGTYNISTTVVNGIIFAANGTFSNTGVQTVSLNGSGTPVSAGTNTVPITAGSTNCTFPVSVGGTTTTPPTSTYFWKFTEGGFLYQGDLDASATLLNNTVTPLGTAAILSVTGTTVTGDTSFNIAVSDFGGGINTNETYSSSSSGTNAVIFQVVDMRGGSLYNASPSTPTVNIIVKITGHNTNTKVIDGTFSGTARNSAGATKTISGGQFKAQYQ